MNTSKSLDEILNSYRYWAGGGKRNSKKLTHQEAKQAIVEAVEGLLGKDEKPTTALTISDVDGKPIELFSPQLTRNKFRAELRQAIKEWQEQGGLVEDSDEK